MGRDDYVDQMGKDGCKDEFCCGCAAEQNDYVSGSYAGIKMICDLIGNLPVTGNCFLLSWQYLRRENLNQT